MPEFTNLRGAEERERLTRRILERLNASDSPEGVIRDISVCIKEAGGFDAVALRLREGEDFPYHCTLGFPEDWDKVEGSLCSTDPAGLVLRDADGKAVLACLCGRALRGAVDPRTPPLTKGGSLWTNRSLAYIPPRCEAADPAGFRMRCVAEGFESMAFVPLRFGGETVGLLQINDRRSDSFTPEMIEYLEAVGSSVGVAIRRLRDQRALHEHERRLDLALRAARMGTWVWDIARGERSFDPFACRLLGVDPTTSQGTEEELYGTVQSDDRERLRLAVAQAAERGGPFQEAFRAVWPDGTVHHLCARASVERDEAGRPLRVDGVLWDVSDRERASEEQARLEGQLQRAQKMESVGRLAGGVAHEFNNLLFVIGSNAEAALLQVDPSLPIHGDLREILAATKRSTELTRQLLTFARKQPVRLQVVDLNDAIRGVLKMLRRLIGEDIRLDWKPGADLWPVRVDPSQIEQVLTNLIVHARDSIADVGTITIETGNRAVLDSRRGDVGPDLAFGEYTWLSVTDDGPGLTQDALSHVFEPFFSPKQNAKGPGLGLAAVYGIAKQHGGFTDVQSQPGVATTFVVHLPRSVGEAGADVLEAKAPPANTRSETILLVEDDESILRSIRKMLEHSGFNVIAASNPADAMRLAEERDRPVHLLLSDIVLPYMNGQDVARELQPIFPQMKRLFMSGYSSEVIAQHGVALEGTAFIQKPFSAEEIIEQVCGLLDAAP
jgi:signal transduction histidine kinase